MTSVSKRYVSLKSLEQDFVKAVEMRSCHCVGPQNGEPLCPCGMMGVVKKDGRWVIPEQDLGPAND